MRKKTEAKRQSILAVATQVFREMGFQNASMNEIATRTGGSKATLYNYFQSKEAIFIEVMRDVAKAQKLEMVSFLDRPFPAITQDSQCQVNEVFSELQQGTEDIGTTLRRFGNKFVAFICQPEILTIRRLLVAESGRTEIGQLFYESGPQRGMERIAEFLEAAMQRGQLRQKQPGVAAAHLRALLESEVHERFLLNVESELSQERLTQVVDNAVRVFLAAYGPE